MENDSLGIPAEVRSKMVPGQGGCPRCDGYVLQHRDYTKEDEHGIDCLRCVNCGGRRWFAFVMGGQGYHLKSTYKRKNTFCD
jgi:hypothetical protein